ncbi:hypothetical protein [Streptomyces sp. H27-C3]|uniref:hypothetical protein n=1 Tax=Streptomyces sp. H27-C3 TaxID=3046305 RepID=UPI0024B92AEA|nr:hypothetical protein [Streptomyces sp. H27-C3]MDJ0460428.1 hypothetical protein [Streptomyces sp. H27-C3]
MTTTLLTDHPAWTAQPDGSVVRVVDDGTGAWCARWTGSRLEWEALTSNKATPRSRRTPAADLPDRASADLRTALAALGTVERLPNPSLWDAITTALLRRIIRAEQARLLYRRWCATYGRRHDIADGPLFATPTPETVLALEGDAPYREVGALFHKKALPAAAAAYLDHASEWSVLDPDDLVKALQEVSGIGPWTAAAAAADFTGDYAVYPHDDLAVRTWAANAAPEVQWPDNAREFAALWHRWAPDRPGLHALTTLTLAWGIHARPSEHHGPDRT